MLNTITLDNQQYICVMCWEDKKNKFHSVEDTKFPTPKQMSSWSSQKFFLEKLRLLEEFLEKEKAFIPDKSNNNCKLCKTKNISKIVFVYKNMIWNEGLKHYVEKHNIKPPSKFIKFVIDLDPSIVNKCKKSIIQLKGKIYKLENFNYVKVKTNQLMILDALMEHGGIQRRYSEKHETGYKYSEHAGMLVFDKSKLDRVVISGSTERTKNNDPEIFLPEMGLSAYDYEYIFHTHPATPTPGGRAEVGILYEFPSTNDIFHFIEHFNNGRVQGSLVLTPEGLYNIRKFNFDKQKITNIDVSFNAKMKKHFNKIQDDAIRKYGEIFTQEHFYSRIAQDTTYIDRVNKLLEQYNLHIDYFPRQKTKTGNWVIGTVYLPVCSSKKL